MSVEALIAWAVAGGVYLEPIEIRVAADGNRSTFARRAIGEGEVVVSIPRSLMIGATDVAASTIGQAMQPFAGVLHSRYMPIAAWVAMERRDDASRWRPYLEALPAEFQTWSPERIAALEGTRAGEMLVQRAAALQDDWALLADLIGDVLAVGAEELDWGLRIARSRCFDVSAAGGEALVPMADMLDHDREPQAVWRVNGETGLFEMRTTREIARGEELRHTYGTFGNAHWLAGHGFVVENNPDDEVTLRLSPDVHVGARFDARFLRAMAAAHAVSGDAAPRAALRVIGDAARRATERLALGATEVAGDESWNRMCRIVRASERAVLADIAEFAVRAEALVLTSAAQRRAEIDYLVAEETGADRLLRGFLLASLANEPTSRSA